MPGDRTQFSNIRAFPKGAVVAAAGESAPRELILLLQGSVGVYRNYGLTDAAQVSVLSSGSFYGECNLFLNREMAETLVALTDVIVMAVGRRNTAEFFVEQTDTAVTLVEGICRKLEKAEEELRKLRGSQAEQSASADSALFPAGHGSYLLPLNNADDHILYLRRYVCPMCGHSFESLAYIATRLRATGTDPDLRTRYRDFEPMYYDIVTCPNCFFSAPFDTFEAAPRSSARRINELLGPYKLSLRIRSGMERDTTTVFAGYYLALLCAPATVDDHQMLTATLWLKLSRLYRDCGDEAMYLYSSGKSLQDFRFAYENLKISEKAAQRVCYMMGELYLRAGETDLGREYFHLAKLNKAGSMVLRRQADVRLEEIREMKRGE